MKRLLALILTIQIFILSLGGIKASLYFAIHKSYILQELCELRNTTENTCQGTCHLKETIKKQAEEDSSRSLVFEGQLSPFYIPATTSVSDDWNNPGNETKFGPWQCTYTSLITGPAFHPPPSST